MRTLMSCVLWGCLGMCVMPTSECQACNVLCFWLGFCVNGFRLGGAYLIRVWWVSSLFRFSWVMLL